MLPSGSIVLLVWSTFCRVCLRFSACVASTEVHPASLRCFAAGYRRVFSLQSVVRRLLSCAWAGHIGLVASCNLLIVCILGFYSKYISDPLPCHDVVSWYLSRSTACDIHRSPRSAANRYRTAASLGARASLLASAHVLRRARRCSLPPASVVAHPRPSSSESLLASARVRRRACHCSRPPASVVARAGALLASSERCRAAVVCYPRTCWSCCGLAHPCRSLHFVPRPESALLWPTSTRACLRRYCSTLAAVFCDLCVGCQPGEVCCGYLLLEGDTSLSVVAPFPPIIFVPFLSS